LVNEVLIPICGAIGLTIFYTVMRPV
jgi:hypothetical protein